MTTTHQTSRWKAVAAGASVLLAVAIVSNVAAQRPTRSKGIMSIEDNKRAALRWSQELWSQGHLAVADEIIAPDYVRHDPGDPFPARGSRRCQADRHDAADDAAGFEDRGGGGDCRGRHRRQPLHGDGYRQRGLHGHATHWKDDSNVSHADVPLFERKDRRELGRARRLGNAAPTRTLDATGWSSETLRIAHAR